MPTPRKSKPTRRDTLQNLGESKRQHFKTSLKATKKADKNKGLGQYTRLPLDELQMGEYQRPLREGWVELLVEAFDPSLFLPLVVALRDADNKYYIVDGQHRYHVARALGWKDVPVLLYLETDLHGEAEQFVGLQSGTMALSLFERFHASLAGGDDECVGVNRIVESFGLHIPRRTGGNKVAGAVGGLSEILALYRRDPEILRSRLDIAKRAFGTRWEGYSGKTLAALDRILVHSGARLRIPLLIEKLRGISPRDLQLRGLIIARTAGISLAQGLAQAIVDVYNHRLANENRIPTMYEEAQK